MYGSRNRNSECIASARWSCLAGVGRPDLRDDGIQVLCYARSAGLRHRRAAYMAALHAMGTGLARPVLFACRASVA